MHREVLVRARWRLVALKACEGERQLIRTGAIATFYPMVALSSGMRATETDRRLAGVGGGLPSPTPSHGDWP